MIITFLLVTASNLFIIINLIRIKLLQLNIRKAKKTSTVYELYIDDQVEIEKIWIICEDLIKSGKIAESSWDIRREILQEIIQGEYFDEYGV